jgi:hypothetical protein
VLNLEHYLDALEHKPGALAGSTPLAQWRARGLWPAAFDTLWAQLMARHGKQDGTREMIAVLQLGRQYGLSQLTATVAQALALGCTEAAAIRHLLSAETLTHGVVESLPVGALACFDRPSPTVTAYDRLLEMAVAS